MTYQEISHCLNAGGMGRIDYETESFVLQQPPPKVLAVALRGRDGGLTAELGGDVSTTLRTAGGGADKPHILTIEGPAWMAATLRLAVRRLMPVECERLQGFPDGFTDIPFRKKPAAADGPRYKALGNSMAVPCMAWLGARINTAIKAAERPASVAA